MLFMKMDLLNYQYLDKMNNNIGILCQYEGKLVFMLQGRFFSVRFNGVAPLYCGKALGTWCFGFGWLVWVFFKGKKMQARSFVVWKR